MKTRDFRWTQRGKRVPEVERIFKAMWRYYDFYLDEAKDLPYWSTEMALVGNLAIASGRLDYPVALEFYHGKAWRRKRKRADLWIGFSSKRDILIEAKCYWPSWKTRMAISKVERYLSNAEKQITQYLKGAKKEEIPRFSASIIFFPFSISHGEIKRDDFKSIKDKCNEFASQFKGFDNISFRAHYFIMNKKIISRFPDEGYCYPGIVVVGRIK